MYGKTVLLTDSAQDSTLLHKPVNCLLHGFTCVEFPIFQALSFHHLRKRALADFLDYFVAYNKKNKNKTKTDKRENVHAYISIRLFYEIAEYCSVVICA